MGGMEIEHTVETPSVADRAKARDVAARLREGDDLIVKGRRGSVTVPRTIAQSILDLIDAWAEGGTPIVSAADEEVSTQQAAEILNLSRPTVVKFLDQGRIPFTSPGKHRRVRVSDLMAFKAKLDRERRAALERVSALSQAAIERASERGRLTDEMI